TFRAIQAFILGLMYYRWARYMIAVGFLLFAVPFTVAALEETNIVQRSGMVAHVRYFTDTETGDYVYSELMLEGSTTTYVFRRNEFTTILPENKLSDAKVDLWVLAGPLEGNPHVVAIQLYGDQGDAVKYVTDGYTHAEDNRNRDLVPGAILLAIALAFAAAGAIAPTARKPARRQPVAAGDGVNVTRV
ncbi:MAG: hypothetical protein ACXWQZ_08825, partial [Ktedonobacterales bacterium]